MTCSDVIAKVRSMLKDIPQATADIDWFDDDTSNSIEVYMSKAPSVTHARMLNIMIKNGFFYFIINPTSFGPHVKVM